MKFKSRVDLLSGSIISIIVLAMLSAIIFAWIEDPNNTYPNLWLTLFLLVTSGLLTHIYTSTYYQIEEKIFKYSSGVFTGSLPVSSIREIDVNKTLWAGIKKPATARKGLIIRYNKFDEIYISPQSNEEIVKEFLKINPEIKINRF